MQKICNFKKKTDCIFEFSTTKLGKNKCQYQCNKNCVPQCNDFVKRIVTVDETWIYQHDPESKMQSIQWLPKGSTGSIKFKSERSVQKVIATVFCDSKRIILVDFFKGSKTTTGIYYEDFLRKFKAAVIKKSLGKLHRGILFHHDNAPAHSSRVARAVLREFFWEILSHPLYSPDLAPLDYLYFSS